MSAEERSVTDEQILKTLMTGLLYPAVLGSVIFIGLDSVVYALRSVREAIHHGRFTVDLNLALRLVALFATTAFYCCAYMYTLFTRSYRRLFFAYDCVFVITLYVTVLALGLQRRATPDLSTMILCFVVFNVLYLAWDLAERKQPSNTPDELRLYRAIIQWEWVSLFAFSTAYLVASIFWHSLVSSAVFVTVLCGTTARFAYLTWRKRLYW